MTMEPLDPRDTKTDPVFDFSFCAALDDGSLYIAGVALALERRDVPHAVLWEHVRGEWKRYQWKNRVYGVAAYTVDGAATAAYLGYEGTVKVRSAARGSSEEVLEAGVEGPSSLRTVSCIRVVGESVFVAGMRRAAYRRALQQSSWTRIDDGLRQPRSDVSLAGLYAIDGSGPDCLCAVGIGGEVWSWNGTAWCLLDSPTNGTWLSIRCLGGDRYLVGGEMGAVWLRDGDQWTEVRHALSREAFTCIEVWQGRCFMVTDSGIVYELRYGDRPELVPVTVPGLARVSSMAAVRQHLFFCGGSRLVSLDAQGQWHDRSPPGELVT